LFFSPLHQQPFRALPSYLNQYENFTSELHNKPKTPIIVQNHFYQSTNPFSNQIKQHSPCSTSGAKWNFNGLIQLRHHIQKAKLQIKKLQ